MPMCKIIFSSGCFTNPMIFFFFFWSTEMNMYPCEDSEPGVSNVQDTG